MSRSLRSLIRSDIDRYRYMTTVDTTVSVSHLPSPFVTARVLLLCQGLQATVVHRLSHAALNWAPRNPIARLVRVAMRTVLFVGTRVVEAVTGISIAERATIGRGLYIGHFGGVIVGVVSLGDNCTLSHGVTIGRSGRRGEFDRPMLGNRVWVGPGAVIAGKVIVGHDAVIGANAVVTGDVPDRTAALGVPARLRAGSASFEMVVYRDSETDPDRRSSMELAARETAERLRDSTAPTASPPPAVGGLPEPRSAWAGSERAGPIGR